MKYCLLLLIISVSYCQSSAPSDSSWNQKIVDDDEPGTPLIVSGIIYKSDGETPLPGANFQVYQTDNEGYYSKTSEGLDRGWRHARISGQFKAGPKGQYRIETIKPAGYPSSRNPSHIHFRINAADYPEQEHTIYFEGDSRITDEVRDMVERYDRLKIVPLEEGENDTLRCHFDIVLTN